MNIKSILLSIIFLLYTLSGVAQNHADFLTKQLLDVESSDVFVVAHRGDWRNAPENSLQAIKNCIEMGVDMVEIDLKMTKDSVLILMHDKMIDRTTTGKGKPEEYTIAELKEFHLRNGAGHATRHQIPTLEEAMLLAKGKILVNIDKGYEYFKEVYKILECTGTTGQCIIKSALPYSQVKSDQGEILEKVIFMPVINLGKPDADKIIADYLAEMRPIAFELVFQEETGGVIQAIKTIKQNNCRIWVNSLWPELCGGHDDDRSVEMNEKEEAWGWIIEQGATLIQTDRPSELIDYLKMLNLKH